MTIANNLIGLTRGATVGDMASLEELVCEFVRRDDLDQSVILVLWEKFALKLPPPAQAPTAAATAAVESQQQLLSAAAESRGALQLLSMAAGAKRHIVKSNVDVLVKEGLGPRGASDFLLTRDVCIALSKLVATKKVRTSTCTCIFMSVYVAAREGRLI